MSSEAELKELRKILAQRMLLELSGGKTLLVKKPTTEPVDDEINPGQFRRYLGAEPVRKRVPFQRC